MREAKARLKKLNDENRRNIIANGLIILLIAILAWMLVANSSDFLGYRAGQ